MKSNYKRKGRLAGVVLSVSTFAVHAAAQATLSKEKAFVDSSGSQWWYTMIFVVLAGLGGAYYFWRKRKKGIELPQNNYGSGQRDYYSSDGGDINDVDAEKELEWLRKAKSASKSQTPGNGSKGSNGARRSMPASVPGAAADGSIDTKVFQEKMRKLQYAQLPINSFFDLAPAKQFEPLTDSDDKSLLNAIEQVNEEFEEDEAVRDIAVRILAAFRNRNSVEALTQVALYDLSSSQRSKAVSVLTDFDHESVFEAILLACADPTREVRAAAARGLFRLNFDRSGAWKRIIETRDEFRMSQAVRAAVESGIVTKSFDRLVHEDIKVAYEAFTLVALLIKSGEDKEIFDAIENHKDERVKFALLHVIKAIKDERSALGLNRLRQNGHCPKDVIDKIDDTIKTVARVTV